MTFRKEDHQAMQSMYHFRIKVDPAFAWGVRSWCGRIKPADMNVPIRKHALMNSSSPLWGEVG